LIVAVLVSYAGAYVVRRYSYEQWKWISFFQPAFVAAVFALLLAAAVSQMSRFGSAARLATRGGALVLGILLVALSARLLETETRYTRAYWVAGEPRLPWSIVSTQLSGLPKRSELDRLDAVNVDMPQWDEMWVAYFLQSKMQVYLLGPSYFPVAPPTAAWTLVSVPVPTVPPANPVVRYVLVRK